MTPKCTSCGAEPAAGRFCASCGALLSPAACESCGNALPPGAKFCNRCGRPAVPAADAPKRNAIPAAVAWGIAAGAVVAVLVVLLLPRGSADGDRADDAPAAAAGALAGDPTSIDISSMTPRERADRLFNRVMQSVSVGDTAQARAFLPMALDAYALVPDLDLDGRYHFAVLHLVNEDPTSARAQADSILQAEPSHLFGLFTAAQAEQALGNQAEAARLYRRFLESYDSEVARDLPEYRDHARVLPTNRAEAEQELER